MSNRMTILVLGAYGGAGREIVRGLIDKTGLNVIVAGRNRDRLAALASKHSSSRLRPRILNAANSAALTESCKDAGLVINAVGPYSMHGADIARTAIESGVPYVDFANEQIHYRRLQQIDPLARERNLLLLTAAGAVPGLSGVLALRGTRHLPVVESIDMFYGQGRMPNPEAGVASLMSGALEMGFGSVTVRDGVQVATRLGAHRRVETLPGLGAAEMIAGPSIETLTVPARIPLRSFEQYWNLGDIPPGTFALIRILKPHRRPWAYRLLKRLTERIVRDDYERGVKKGLTAEGILKIIACGGGHRWEATVTCDDGFVATAYLPVIAAKRFAEGRLSEAGLVTPLDVFEWEGLMSEIAELGWPLRIQEQVSDPYFNR